MMRPPHDGIKLPRWVLMQQGSLEPYAENRRWYDLGPLSGNHRVIAFAPFVNETLPDVIEMDRERVR